VARPGLWRPVTAVGSMSLTSYVLLGFIAGVVVFALVWSRFFRRGPLEFLLHRATTLAK
jgi:uncharacterized membrane protein YeiB